MAMNFTKFLPGVQNIVRRFEQSVSEVLGHKVTVEVKITAEITIDSLEKVIVEECGIDLQQLYSHSKKRIVVIARQLFILYGMGLCGCRSADIAKRLKIHQSNITHLMRDASNHLHAKDERYCSYNEKIKQRLFA